MTTMDPLRDSLRALGGQVGLVALCGFGLLVFVWVLRQLLGGRRAAFPYERRGPLFTLAERTFLDALGRAGGEALLIFGKVRLADILQPREGLPRPEFLQALNRVTSYTISDTYPRIGFRAG